MFGELRRDWGRSSAPRVSPDRGRWMERTWEGWSNQYVQARGLGSKKTDQHRHSSLPVLPSYRHRHNQDCGSRGLKQHRFALSRFWRAVRDEFYWVKSKPLVPPHSFWRLQGGNSTGTSTARLMTPSSCHRSSHFHQHMTAPD